MVTRLLLLCLVPIAAHAATTVGSPASGTVSAPAGAAPAAATIPTLDSEQWTFLSLLNAYRAQNGAGPLQVSIALENSSQWMSVDMSTKNYFSHTDSLGRNPGQRLAAFGYSYPTGWGENIAAGNGGARDTLIQWATACDPDPKTGICTYGHRQNMLNPSWVVIGIGRAYSASSTYGWYWTTDFAGFLDQTIPTPTAPSPPTGLTAQAGDAQVWLSWGYPGLPGDFTFHIYYQTSPGVNPTSPASTMLTSVSNSLTVSNLLNGTTYYFVVTDVNASGESVPSPEVSAVPVAPSPLPGSIIVTGTASDLTDPLVFGPGLGNARSLAHGSDGKLHAVYARGAPLNIYYAYSTDNGLTWTEEGVSNQTGSNAQVGLMSMAVDSANNVHVV